MNKHFLVVFTLARIDIKRLFRDKVAIFFVFVFPLVFLMIFGSIFGGDDDISFRVGFINQSESQFSREFAKQATSDKAFEIDQKITSVDQAREKMNRGQLDATIVLPRDFGELRDRYPSGQVQILYDQNNESAGKTLTSLMQGILTGINQGMTKAPQPLSVKAQSTATQGLEPFDYVFSGLLGFSLLSLGIFGPTTVFPKLKQRGALRRYSTTPIKVWQYFVGNVISNSFIGLLSVALMFAAAFAIFDLNMRGDFLNLAIVVIMGTVMLFGIGLAIGGWAKNENQAQPLAQVVAMPMMFLSGVFFPTFLMPEALQNVTKFIPLTPVVDASRYVITEGKTVLELGPQIGLIALWTAVIYLIAFRVFRW